MKTDHDLVTIKDYGRPEYLDGAMMQYSVVLGEYLKGETIAHCETLEHARLLANALTLTNGNARIVIDES